MKNILTGKTRLFLCVSGAIIVIALVLQIAGAGLNLGIDFNGGTVLNYSVRESYDADEVKAILADAGYSDSRVRKAEPSDASVELQAKLAEDAAAESSAADTDTTDGEAAETSDADTDTTDGETAESSVADTDTTDGETAETTATEAETTEASDAETADADSDGLTDLQIQLNLTDRSAALEDAVTAAVQGLVSDAKATGRRTLNYTEISELGADAAYEGGYVFEFSVGSEPDENAVAEAVRSALEGEYSLTALSAARYEIAAETDTTAETEAAETETDASAETDAATDDTTAEADAATESGLRVLVRVDDELSRVCAEIEAQMSAKHPNFHLVSADRLGGTVGGLLGGAVKALVIALVCALAYIAIRDGLHAALTVLLAVIHDVLIACAFTVFFRIEVNNAFIAAMLAVAILSLTHSALFFGRVHETAKKPGWTQKSRAEIAEACVSETLQRILGVALVALIAALALCIFGAAPVREAAFPLLVGVLANAYSSVLLSGQVWARCSDCCAARKGRKTGKA